MQDIIWLITASAFVLLMQAGFTCLETGLVRSKNSINVAIKNLMDMCISSAIFWLVGYGIMFGSSVHGLIGSSEFLFDGDLDPKNLAFFIFQMMFCGTAITIVSGAVAERMSFMGYMMVSALTSILVYPVIGHWAWSGLLSGEMTGWLGQAGFIDFAGSTVVHSVGGWVALAAIIIIGPRTGRFNKEGREIQGSNLTISVLGVILLWFGWIGFNAGSALEASEVIPLIIINTCLAAVFGGLTSITVKYILNSIIDVKSAMNGVLGGLVTITASCNIVSPVDSVLLAIVAGNIVVAGDLLLQKLKLDDAVGVIPVHLLCGIWGTIALVIVSTPESWGTGLSMSQQLNIQVGGVLAIGLYAFLISYTGLRIVDYFLPLRVSSEAEFLGLNVSEHNAASETLDLYNEMETHRLNGDFSSSVSVEPFTEAGQIAKQYNNVLKRVNDEIEHREQAINSFKTSESRRDALLSASLDCIITIDKEGLIQEFNPAAEKCFGYSRARILNESFIEYFIPLEKQNDFKTQLGKDFSADRRLLLDRHNKVLLKRMHGIEFPAELSITKVTKASQLSEEFNLHIRDIFQQVKQQQVMKQLAYNDPLTGLYNRSYFSQQLKYQLNLAAKNGNSIILMFLDLDQFKSINDNLGHAAGDAVLVEVAARLNVNVREEDIVCRWGGDEFIILFSLLDDQGVITKKAKDILKSMCEPFLYDGVDLPIRTSIGISGNSDGILPEQMVQRADMALYAAKKDGKNTFRFFMSDMEEQANKKFYYETELRTALEKEQFSIVYQPKVNCRNNNIYGFEALLRWNHPSEGFVSPAVFIPILEESVVMEDVSRWILATVCSQIANWQAMNVFDFYVAVNLSVRDFLSDDLDIKIQTILWQNKVEGRYLELEITETVLAENTEQCIKSMHKIKQLGVRFAIDDFGTGFASMSYLKQFPVDTLKIDKVFIDHCDSNKEDAAICTAIIALGKSLGLQLVAEGVETQSQLNFLKETECELYQGFLYSRPLPVDKIQKFLVDSISETLGEVVDL